ncbi:hypothetical protein [Sporosarcina psychrophila]|uniref:Uncharacterized protein n=1 Tax=Sporosarcina psychrophila TaxID=1476 RepID=A0ABV2KGL3_SPOPS
MYKDLNFIDGVLEGDYLLSEVDDFVDAWHDSEDENDISLQEFLGMTEKEYKLWAEKGDSSLKIVLSARKDGVNLDTLLEDASEMTWAARAKSSDALTQISNFLTKRDSGDE